MRRADVVWVGWVVALLIACTAGAAHAQVYRCTARNGSIAYQDHACAHGQHQKILAIPSRPPPGYVPPPVATTLQQPVASALPPPITVAAPAPLPMLYACVGAVNGKRYLTRHPPPPYLAPLGMLGYPPRSLVQDYGDPGGADVPTPGLAPKPRVGGPPVAAGMTEVRDTCTPATHAEVCAYVQREYVANQHELALAMRHAQPPLERRNETLQEQLRSCR